MIEIEEVKFKKMLKHFQQCCFNICFSMEEENYVKAALSLGMLISSINNSIYDYDLQDLKNDEVIE